MTGRHSSYCKIVSVMMCNAGGLNIQTSNARSHQNYGMWLWPCSSLRISVTSLPTPMWKDARHVWIIACMCLLHPTLASFSSWLRIIGGVVQYVTIRRRQVPMYAALMHPRAAAYIRVQLRTYTRTTLRI